MNVHAYIIVIRELSLLSYKTSSKLIRTIIPLRLLFLIFLTRYKTKYFHKDATLECTRLDSTRG